MFGYITINKAEMKFKEFDVYHSYYCGLCKVLRKRYGTAGQLSLSYDLTFLQMLLSGLYEPETMLGFCKCVAHPLERHEIRTNEITDYIADMNIVLAFYKCLDDWEDERKWTRLLYGKLLRGKQQRLEAKKQRMKQQMPEQAQEQQAQEQTSVQGQQMSEQAQEWQVQEQALAQEQRGQEADVPFDSRCKLNEEQKIYKERKFHEEQKLYEEQKYQEEELFYARKIKRIGSLMQELSACEKKAETDIDKMAGLFGQVMAEIVAYKSDEWYDNLHRLGFFLGKFIYLLDAYEDIEEDLRKGNYNPLITLYEHSDFEEECRSILTMMMAQCCKEFEKLPILENVDILRNILYSGVWTKYEIVKEKRKKKDNKNV